MKATLWDGRKQLDGDLRLEEDHIKFELKDFSETNLDLNLAYEDISAVKLFRIYNLEIGALEIISTKDEHNVFVLDDAEEVKSIINKKINNQ